MILKDVLKIQDTQLKNHAITCTIKGDDFVVHGYKNEFKQVLLNIIQNCTDSISGVGQITLTTEAQDSSIIIKFEDTGCGIFEGDKKYLFEPFFSTKVAEQGTGLGLSISYGIIRDHGGDIEVESELDKGTTFIISIPIKIK